MPREGAKSCGCLFRIIELGSAILFRIMRALITSVFCLTAFLPCLGQTADTATPGLPKDPRAIFAAAAPFYNFNDATLEPWHLKATYQLYDQDGKPTEKGTYEYWWVSPKVYRSTWSRPGATHTVWHTADGTHSFKVTGEGLKFFEHELKPALFSPLPSKVELDSDKIRLDLQEKSSKGVNFPCISLTALPQQGQPDILPPNSISTYCFDPQLPVLRVGFTFGEVVTRFNNIVKYQNRFLAREILISYGERLLFSARVDAVDDMDSSDPALTPAPDATQVQAPKAQIGSAVSVGKLIKKQAPVYPELAKRLYQQGKVVILATIGTNGRIHDQEVVVAPSELLAAAAMQAVSQWRYSPYLLNGQPVEVDTTINVFFVLGHSS
jgi:TonB family protein